MPESVGFLKRLDVGAPIVATAIHNGHDVRPEIGQRFSISDSERLREEDPFTGQIARVAPTWVVGKQSRFEVDLNRPRDQAIYRVPEQAWGLNIWRETLPRDAVERSLAEYDEFYESMALLLRGLLDRHERVVVLDLHSYNHRRGGPDGPLDDPAANPEINIGTGSMDRARWERLVDRFIADLGAASYPGRRLDVRENVKFFGGHLSQWIHRTFPHRVCAIAVEFKKYFMDEWTGKPNQDRIDELAAALGSTFPGLRESLDQMSETSLTADREHSLR